MKLQNDHFNIRIKRIEFKNFRNIESGVVDFPNTEAKDFYDGNPSILGLYGQNGSGKSSVIMSLGILKNVLSGKKINEKYESCIRTGCNSCTLNFTFSAFARFLDDESRIIQDNFLKEGYEYYYSFDIIRRNTEQVNEFGRTEESTSLAVENEILKMKVIDLTGKTTFSKHSLFDTRKSASEDKGILFGNKKSFFCLTLNGNKEILDQYIETKIISKEKGTSFLFSNSFNKSWIELYSDADSESAFNNTIEKYYKNLNTAKNNEQYINKNLGIEIANQMIENSSDEDASVMSIILILGTYVLPILNLKYFGYYYLHVVDTITTGITNINTRLPLLLWTKNKQNDISVNKFSLMMDTSTSVLEKEYIEIEKALNSISNVLSKIVPNMLLSSVIINTRRTKDNDNEVFFEILSKRNDDIIPLRYESDGIRRMVSILSLLIAVYNEESFTVAIDEIDSGIFEYMLGELLSVMSESAKGQFVFTSHNLRPLEVLPSKFLCFTTVNPKNRFTTLPRRGNSNMRDTYFRNIILGSNNKDQIYSATDKYEIERAFYNAGHLEDEE